jgi:hypothetical protein
MNGKQNDAPVFASCPFVIPVQLKRRFTWLLLSAFACFACAGVGIHMLPGFGHATWQFGQLLLLGVDLGDGYEGELDQGQPVCSRATGLGIPILSEDQCPICSSLGQRPSQMVAVSFDSSLPFTGKLIDAATNQAPSVLAESCDARAPPIA